MNRGWHYSSTIERPYALASIRFWAIISSLIYMDDLEMLVYIQYNPPPRITTSTKAPQNVQRGIFLVGVAWKDVLRLTHHPVKARVDAQHSSVRGLLELRQQLRRQQEISEIVHRQVGFQTLRRHFSGLLVQGHQRSGS